MRALLLALAVAMPAAAADVVVVDDAIPAPLTATPGDPARGAALVASRAATCVLCHPGPFPAEQLPATIAPDLRGVGSRLTPAQIRLRLVDPAVLNPESLMPAYFRTEGLVRVGRPWQGRPALTAQQIEDAVAWLATLKEE